MAIGTGPTASTDTGAASASVPLTIPGGVSAGDVLLIAVAAFLAGTTKPVVTVTSTGTTPVQIGTAQAVDNGTNSLVGTYWQIPAAASESGKTLTIAATINSFFSVVLADYTGANSSSPVDVSGFATPNTGVQTIICPTLTTGPANDWGIFMATAGLPNATMTDPAGSTQRIQHVSGSLIGASICDTNAAVASGASIGGSTFGSGAAAGTWLSAMTLGLAVLPPPASGLILPGGVSGESARWVSKSRILGL